MVLIPFSVVDDLIEWAEQFPYFGSLMSDEGRRVNAEQ